MDRRREYVDKDGYRLFSIVKKRIAQVVEALVSVEALRFALKWRLIFMF